MGLYSGIRSASWYVAGYPADCCSRLLRLSELWSREEMANFRNGKLRKLVAHCYANVPYYRNFMDREKLLPNDIQRAEDLGKLPILTKDILRRHSKELMAANVSTMKVTWPKTGGTTGEPIQICRNDECTAWANMCYERGLQWGGLRPDIPRISLFGGSLGLDKTRLTSQIGQMFRRDLFLPAFELRTDTAPSYFQKIRRSNCRYLIGYTSSVYRLAVLAEEMNQKLTFEAVFPTAEVMFPEWEEFIRKVFSCAVLPYYGCGEVNSLGYHTLESNGYLIPEEHVIVEIVQKDSSTQLFGDGRFLVTDLDNYAMPILRYANGDAGKITSLSNSHLPFNRIERLDGRSNSFLMTDTGELISGAIGPHIFRHLQSVESYQIIQEEPLRIEIKIVPRANFSGQDENLITQLFTNHLGSTMKVTIEKVSFIPRPPSGKSIFVINRCL